MVAWQVASRRVDGVAAGCGAIDGSAAGGAAASQRASSCRVAKRRSLHSGRQLVSNSSYERTIDTW